jgi:predicted Zn-dependent protease
MARDIQNRQPQSPLGHALEAEVLEHDKKPLDAAKKYVKVAEMTGQASMVARAAQAFISGGQGAEAEKLLTRRLASNPNDAVIRRALGQYLISKGRLREATAHFETLVKAFPRDIPSLNNLAWLYGEQKHPRALAVAEQALAASPQNPAVMDTVGWVMVNQGEVKRGLELLRQAAARMPDNPELQWHVANAYAKAGEKASARLELERLINSGRNFPQQAEVKKLLDSLR